MRKLASTLLVPFCLGLCPMASAQSLPSVTELAHPDAKVLLGLNVRQLRESAAAESAKQAWASQLKAFGTTGPTAGFTGLELLNDIDLVMISSPGEKPAAAAPSATAARPATSARKNPPFVAVLQGNFPPSHYKAMLQGPGRAYRGLTVYKPSKTDDVSLAVLDEHTLVFGDEKSLLAALDRRGRGVQAPADLLNRAAALATENDFWLVVSDLASAVPATGPNAAMAAQFASQLNALEAGVSLREGLKLSFNLVAKSESTVQMLAGLLGSQVQMVASQSGNPQAADILKKLNVVPQGNRLNLSISLSREELDQQIRTLQAARLNPRPVPKTDVTIFPPQAGRPSQAAVSSASPASPAAEPQGPRKIRIFGLDDGVKEIPLDGK